MAFSDKFGKAMGNMELKKNSKVNYKEAEIEYEESLEM